MFCGNCGAQNEDNAVICAGCGAKLNAAAPAENAAAAAAPAAAGADNKNKKVGIIAVASVAAVVVIALVVLLVSLSGGKGYEKTAVKYFKTIFDGDAEGIFDLFPGKFVKKLSPDDYKILIEYGNDELEDALDHLADRYGKKYEVDFEVEDVSDIDEDDLEDLQDKYDDGYDIKVSDAKDVEIEIRVEGDYDRNSSEITVRIIKADGAWCIDPFYILRTGVLTDFRYIFSNF